jgi:hypothetical protein
MQPISVMPCARRIERIEDTQRERIEKNRGHPEKE